MCARVSPGRFVRGGVVLAVGAGVLGALVAAGRPDDHEQVFAVHNLVSDGTIRADHTDANLVNAWGIVPNPTGFWWVSDNGTGVSTLYDGDGNPQSLVVTIPTPPGDTDPAKVTGIVFYGGSGFVVSDGTHSGPSRFIFSTEDGVIAGWSPAVPPPPPSTQAMRPVDNSAAGSIYKGLAIAHDDALGDLLYATDFHNGRVDVFDSNFGAVTLPRAFRDHSIPAGFAPFGIRNLGGRIFVTYAMQDEDAEDDVAGKGLGFVRVFDTRGRLLSRFASRGKLNAPWGLALAPATFGRFRGDVLIGNFGDGRINAYNARTGEFQGQLRERHGRPVEIEGLWGLDFGNGGAAGSQDTLFFSAGPDDEEHGLFGRLDRVPHHGD